MEALDLLKKDWQKQEITFEQVSEASIYGMLHKKSSSIVKWILIISLIELGLGLVLSLLSFDMKLLQKLENSDFGTFLKIATLFNYIVILFFVYKFYINYRKIATTNSTKKLMNDIIATRKTVRNYIFYNLFMVGISVVFAVIYAVNQNPNFNSIPMNLKNIVVFALISVGIVACFVGCFWVIYNLIYGRLLRKLFANYKELQKIDL
jgi:hypothetical protein